MMHVSRCPSEFSRHVEEGNGKGEEEGDKGGGE